MANPAYGALTPRFAGTLRSDSQNVEQVTRLRSRNMFDMSFENYLSLRFGEVRPFNSERCIDRDTATLSNEIELWSTTLKSPLMSGLTMYKDYFYIPFKAIYPNTWDKFKNTPIQGDDVPSDVYGNFPLLALVKHLARVANLEAIDLGSNVAVTSQLRATWLLLQILSSDSLLQQLWVNSSTLLDSTTVNALKSFGSIDSVIERDLPRFLPDFSADVSENALNLIIGFTYETSGTVSTAQLIIATRSSVDDTFVFDAGAMRRLFSLMPYIKSVASVGSSPNLQYIHESVRVLCNGIFALILNYSAVISSAWAMSLLDTPCVDLSELYAYQLIGAQFYVNDNVDSVITASDWLDNIRSLIYDVFYSFSPAFVFQPFFFDYNGTSVPYDILSKKYMLQLVSLVDNDPSVLSDESYSTFLSVIQNIFCPFESMRYGDYFTGSRLSPLAVGADVHAVAPVTSNEVQAIDMTIALSWQSYLNDIMKLGPVAWIQQNGIYGDVPTSLDPMPRFISRERQQIGAMQIENTSENQGNIVSRFRSEFQQFAYQCDIREDSIIMGLVSFDIPRIYQNTTSRFAFTFDRYDFFQPYFQNIGDQAIYRSELSLGLQPENDADFVGFAYQLRDTQYKQRYNRCSGAFVGDYFLPSWAMVDDNSDCVSLTPYLVRNHNSDFDRFFESLPNFTPAGYFHFYVRVRNYQTFTRAMQYRPDIQTPSYHM